MIPYCLDGLSVSASALLAERMIKEKAPQNAAKLETRQSVDYLRRIFILLEGNPEAIMAVLPNLWKSDLSTKELFEMLLSEACPLDEVISQNSRFLRTIRSVNSQQEFFSAFGTGYIIPWHLFPFWNIMPARLDEYFYFMYWKLGGLSGSFARERSYSYSLTINMEVDAFEVNHQLRTEDTLERILESLEKAGIIHPVQATFKEEDEEEEEEDDRLHADERDLWHVHPLFTLCARSMAPDEILHAGKYAFVRHQSVWGKKSLRHNSPKFQEVVWDNEIQHVDHSWNNHIAALLISLSGDIVQETHTHGFPMTDVLLLSVEEGFHHNRRLNEVVKPIARRHINRLFALPTLRGDGLFSGFEKNSLLSNVYRFVKDDAANASELLEATLVLGTLWRNQAQDLDNDWLSSNEQSWLELSLTKCQLTMVESHAEAKGELEKVLQTDPLFPLSDPLYGAIRRVYAQLLMLWFQCAAYQIGLEKGMDKKTMMTSGAKMFIELAKASKIGDMFKNFFENPDIKDSLHLPLRDGMAPLLQQFSADVEKFGFLVQSILDEPIWKMFSFHRDGTVEDHIVDLTKPGGMNKMLTDVTEFHFRSLAGEGASAQHLLNGAIAAQTTSASGGPRELLALLEMSYFEAKEQGDWLKTLKILDDMERLEQDLPMKPGDRARRHITYADSLDELGRGDECARRMIKASDILLDCLDDEHANTWFLQGAGCFKSLQVASTEGQLSFSERHKLRKILQRAEEYKLDTARKRAMNDLNEMMKQARIILGQDNGTLPT
ncbi:uncharacterized protein CTRU02_202992 [Colletotrichum truncatum]|uniref:Uncharacterized protein n=1 Tax=Colletotrichum truncatum TaxID=5467 RepID=A0ACC3Z7Z8_COLTU